MRTLRRLATLPLLGASVVAPLAAQGTGRLTGRVHDSLLTRAPLARAEVVLLGLDRTTLTDADGRWTLDSVPAGRWRLAFTHAVLEEARLTAPTLAVDVLAGETADALLATPSDATLHGRACGAERKAGTGVLLGDVTVGDLPAAGAAVRVLWREWSLVPGGEPEEVAREAVFDLDATGRFFVCGVPTDRVVTVAAIQAGQAGRRELRLNGREVGLVHLALAEPEGAGKVVALAGDAAAPDETGVLVVQAMQGEGTMLLRGAVRDRDGAPLAGARVTLLGSDATATTRGDGSFQFANVPRDLQTLDVAAVGFVPRRVEVDVRPGRLTRADVALDKVAYVLQPLIVKAQADPQRAALERRLRLGNGQFLTRAQIEQRNAYSVSDLLKGMNGVQLRTTGMSTVLVMSRGAGVTGRFLGGLCVPAYFVDGSMVGTETQGDALVDSTLYATGGALPAGTAADPNGGAPVGVTGLMPRDAGPDQFVHVSDIETLEVYTSATLIPPEFAAYNGACGVVAIWTRRGLPTVREDSDGR